MPDAIGGRPVETVDGGDLDYEDEAEPGPDWGPGARLIDTTEMDAAALRERLDAPPTPKPEVSTEERRALVAGCLDGILANGMIHGAADLLVRELAERLSVAVEEAGALLSEEAARRSGGAV